MEGEGEVDVIGRGGMRGMKEIEGVKEGGIGGVEWEEV